MKNSVQKIFALSFLVSFVSAGCHADGIPMHVSDLAKKKWPECRISPSMEYKISGDFNRDGRPDVAVVLMCASGWSVKAFHALENNHIADFTLDNYPGDSAAFTTAHPIDQFHLRVILAGTTQKIGTETVTFDRDVIVLETKTKPVSGFLFRWIKPQSAQTKHPDGRYASISFGDFAD
jgi:hypothetical protein